MALPPAAARLHPIVVRQNWPLERSNIAIVNKANQGGTGKIASAGPFSALAEGRTAPGLEPDEVVTFFEDGPYMNAAGQVLVRAVIGDEAGAQNTVFDAFWIIDPGGGFDDAIVLASASDDAGVCGDANSDASVSASDALAVLLTAVGLDTCELCVCDVDQSGTVSATDALVTLPASSRRNSGRDARAPGLLAQNGVQAVPAPLQLVRTESAQSPAPRPS